MPAGTPSCGHGTICAAAEASRCGGTLLPSAVPSRYSSSTVFVADPLNTKFRHFGPQRGACKGHFLRSPASERRLALPNLHGPLLELRRKPFEFEDLRYGNGFFQPQFDPSSDWHKPDLSSAVTEFEITLDTHHVAPRCRCRCRREGIR